MSSSGIIPCSDTCGIPEPKYVWVLRDWPNIKGIYSTEDKAMDTQAKIDYSLTIEKHELNTEGSWFVVN